jgi:hypothetical protein
MRWQAPSTTRLRCPLCRPFLQRLLQHRHSLLRARLPRPSSLPCSTPASTLPPTLPPLQSPPRPLPPRHKNTLSRDSLPQRLSCRLLKTPKLPPPRSSPKRRRKMTSLRESRRRSSVSLILTLLCTARSWTGLPPPRRVLPTLSRPPNRSLRCARVSLLLHRLTSPRTGPSRRSRRHSGASSPPLTFYAVTPLPLHPPPFYRRLCFQLCMAHGVRSATAAETSWVLADIKVPPPHTPLPFPLPIQPVVHWRVCVLR